MPYELNRFKQKFCMSIMALAVITLTACNKSHQLEQASPATTTESQQPLAKLGYLSTCAQYSGVPQGWQQHKTAGMVRIARGEFNLGSNKGYQDELPLQSRKTTQVPAFWIDQTEVTNAQFASFVAATGYVTDAEKLGGAVFIAPKTGERLSQNSWWHFIRQANWRQPTGIGSNIKGKDHLPVVLVTKRDAEQYAAWLGHELPTEAQWEYAAKAGNSLDALDHEPHDQHGAATANYWQGSFPLQNTQADHFKGIAPVGCYAANNNQLFDMIGNVWEWTRDAYLGGHQDGHQVSQQDHGYGNPALSRSHAPTTAGAALFRPQAYVIKGGSYLCAPNFCVRYRESARYPQEADLPTSHVGFRTVLND